MNKLAIPKGKKAKRPLREPDLFSKRGIPYWFAPEWVRDLNGSMTRIIPLKTKKGIELNILAKNGNISFIQGSIQQEFLDWHVEQQVEAIIFGLDESEIIATNWDYEDV